MDTVGGRDGRIVRRIGDRAMNNMNMTLADWLIGIGAVILGVSVLMLLVESEARKILRESDDLRRHVNREDQGD